MKKQGYVKEAIECLEIPLNNVRPYRSQTMSLQSKSIG